MSATGVGSAQASGAGAYGTGAGDSGDAATGAEPVAGTVDAGFTVTPPPPYVAVIFTSRLADHPEGYDRVAARLETLAREQPGFLGVESARGTDGCGNLRLLTGATRRPQRRGAPIPSTSWARIRVDGSGTPGTPFGWPTWSVPATSPPTGPRTPSVGSVGAWEFGPPIDGGGMRDGSRSRADEHHRRARNPLIR